MPPDLEVRMLGEFEVRWHGQPQAAFQKPRLRALLAYILLNRASPISRQRLAYTFWPETPDTQALSNLRTLLHRLKEALPELDECLQINTHEIRWQDRLPYWLDIAEFEGLAQANDPESLSLAAQLYRGDLLHACYEEWVVHYQDEYRRMYQLALVRLVEHYRMAGDFHQAIAHLKAMQRLDPYDEGTYCQLFELHACSGDRAAVVRTYRQCRELLASDLGLEPSEQTRSAYEHWRNLDSRPASETSTNNTRSKLGRLASREFRSTDFHHNIPHSITSFVGRQEANRQLQSLLNEYRLVTITGYGGVGKTRLAQQSALELGLGFPDGVRWLSLAPVENPSLLAPALVAALSDPGQIQMTQSLDNLFDQLQGRQILLILDNCEHLTQAVGELSLQLLHACPRMRILCTSRIALRVPGEATYYLPALDTPQVGEHPLTDILNLDSVRLFMQRARAVRPAYQPSAADIQAIGQICRQLSGLPLGIEMAAAWIKLFPPHEISSRLRDALSLLKQPSHSVLPHQETMRATLEWSYRLLDQGEQTLLCRLAVFNGAFTLEAAEMICSDNRLPKGEILDRLAGLIDHSLVETLNPAAGVRFGLHELTRQFALQKLVASDGATSVYEKVLDYYARLAAEAETKLRGPDLINWLAHLEAEQDNLRAALSYALDQLAAGNAATSAPAFQLIGGLWLYWFIRGHFTEGRMWAERAVSMADSLYPRASSPCKGWYALASFAYFMGDYEYAQQASERSLVDCQTCGDSAGIVISLHHLGLLALVQGLYEPAREQLFKGLHIAREAGDPWLVSLLLSDLAHLDYHAGDLQQALALHQERLEIVSEAGDPFLALYTLHNIANILFLQGETTLSRTYLDQAEPLAQQLGEKRMIASAKNLRALYAHQAGQLLDAHAVFLESIQLIWEVRDLNSLAEYLLDLAVLMLDMREPVMAATILGASLVTWEKMAQQLDRPLLQKIDQVRDRTLVDLGEPAFISAEATGRRIALPDLITQLISDKNA